MKSSNISCALLLIITCYAIHVSGQDNPGDKIIKLPEARCKQVCKQAPNCIGCCAQVATDIGSRFLGFGTCDGPKNDKTCMCAIVIAKPKTCKEKGGTCQGGWARCPNNGRQIGTCSYTAPCCT